jgi:hypothetical protein
VFFLNINQTLQEIHWGQNYDRNCISSNVVITEKSVSSIFLFLLYLHFTVILELSFVGLQDTDCDDDDDGPGSSFSLSELCVDILLLLSQQEKSPLWLEL